MVWLLTLLLLAEVAVLTSFACSGLLAEGRAGGTHLLIWAKDFAISDKLFCNIS
jgi:hypothetical protein